MKKKTNAEATTFLRRYLAVRGGAANCMWTRQSMREEGFSNGQIRYAVLKLRLKVRRDPDDSTHARTFDAWTITSDHDEMKGADK